MIEIEALRALVDEQNGPGQDPDSAQEEIKMLRRQLTEKTSQMRSTADSSITADLRAEIHRLQEQLNDKSQEVSVFKREITELKNQLDARTKDREGSAAEVTKLRH